MNEDHAVQNKNNFKDIVFELIEKRKEGEYWDFKETWHDNKSDMLHDILCLANNLVDRDSYLVFGIRDKTFDIMGVQGDGNRKNLQQITDWLNSEAIVFSGGIRPNIEIITLTFQDNIIDVLIIKNSNNTPFFIDKDYRDNGKIIRAGVIYSRANDTNTPINKSANIVQIEYLWKKRFFLDKSPIIKIFDRLKYFNEWEYNDELGTYFNKINPEYIVTLRNRDDDDSSNNPEFYAYIFPDHSVKYDLLNIKYFNTIVYQRQTVYLDGCRYLTTVPNWGCIGDKCEKYFYKYFIKNSYDFILHNFLWYSYSSPSNLVDSYHVSFLNKILVYENEEEKSIFEEYIYKNIEELNESFNLKLKDNCYSSYMHEEDKKRFIVSDILKEKYITWKTNL